MKEGLYTLLRHEMIDAFDGEARLYEHVISGMKIVFLKNEDPHKTFSISFKTLPQDDTGIFHIIEHSVCCASKKYPLKDAFMSFDQGSVNTALNACTYKDMTMYYGASLHHKDFKNIIDLYMDLVFNPLMYEDTAIFNQEGWHYTLGHYFGELKYNGIVYNEMQGEYSEVSTWYDYEVHKALFKDTCYRYDSGGVPQSIPTLSEEAFLRGHKLCYQPDNAIICLYGDIDRDILTYLHDTYLKHMSRSKNQFQLEKQPPFKEPLFLEATYPVEIENEPILYGMSFVVGEATDTTLRLSFQMLEHMLLKSAASPLAAALIEQGKLGKLLGDMGYDPGKYQPTFAITLHDCVPGEIDTFQSRVIDTLRKLVQEGLPEELVDAAFNTISFAHYEGDGSSEPKGILLSEDVLINLLYDGEPFGHLKYKACLHYIEEHKDKGYFEQLIDTYFLQNKHCVTLAMLPSTEHFKQLNAIEKKQLATVKKQLSWQQKQLLLKKNKTMDVKKWEDDMALLPELLKEDIEKSPAYLAYKKEDGDITFLWHEDDTKDIIYSHLLFDASSIPQEDICYLGLLAHLLTYLSTENLHFEALENQINKETGGLNCTLNAYSTKRLDKQYTPYFKISFKWFIYKKEQLIPLMTAILTKARFTEKDKLYDLMQMIQHEYKKSFYSAPEYRAAKKCYSYFNEAGMYEDEVAGLAFYRFITACLEKYDDEWEIICKKLEEIYQKVLQRQHLLISTTCNPKNQDTVREFLKIIIQKLPQEQIEKQVYTWEKSCKREGFIIPSQVQSVAVGCHLKDIGLTFSGVFYVISRLLNTKYLWEEVRLKGGAYGADFSITRDGDLLCVSYCDPCLVETLMCFSRIGEYLAHITLTDKELERCIIGALGEIDYPLDREQKSEQVIFKYLSGISNEQLEKERNELLNTTVAQIRSIGEAMCHMPMNRCVIGSGHKLKRAKKKFDTLETI